MFSRVVGDGRAIGDRHDAIYIGHPAAVPSRRIIHDGSVGDGQIAFVQDAAAPVFTRLAGAAHDERDEVIVIVGTAVLCREPLSGIVGMLKGPSFYNPRRNPNNATKRRNLVLRVLNTSNKISDSSFETLKNKELGVSLPNYRTETRYPAFHDIVRLELQKNFDEKELRTKGLAVETNLDPVLQDSLENNLRKTKLQLIKKYGSRLDELEGAAIAVDISSGEVKAVAGSTKPSSYGFNRSINAIRPIGSLVKPFIYLTALDKYNDYNLTTLLDDSKLSLMSGGKVWEPDNFDKKFHGEIPLHLSLIHI